YFRANYNKAMQSLPVVNSQVQILRMEVWVTNRTGATTETRDVVGLMDLGESSPYNNRIISNGTGQLPDNGANNLYSGLINTPSIRNPVTINTILLGKGLRPVEDY